jgi:thiol-disulfide isomerase/thioredoxin
MITREQFESGLHYDAYLATVEKNRDVFVSVYQNPGLSVKEIDFFQSLGEINLAFIGEDWCPDVYHTMPLWGAVAAAADNVAMRVFPRDSREDIMQHFLTDGTRKRIPVLAFYDGAMNLLFWWAGRSKQAQDWWDAQLAGRKYPDDIPEDERKRISQEFNANYAKTFRMANFREVVAKLAEALGVEPPRAEPPRAEPAAAAG